ncbi:MAG: aminotransferase class I/II-fold pyridoxal phosphate-dependent enzyme [Hyphomicrobiaceae bacterium]|nr:aminotransferase class I/II-fold pyridoxal phosphate-dependent enzyme [Hyphomicrobiaceae bacterium]
MIPIAVPNLSGREREYLNQCIDTEFVSSVGPFVDRFEKMAGELSGGVHAIATSSGTTALHAALVGAGVEPGDLVVLPTYTFIASANAINQCGATPWLVDVSAESWTLDADLVAAAFREEVERIDGAARHLPTGRRIGAIMPVYTMGTPADMDAIASVAETYGIPVVADGAAAMGATYKGRPLGRMGAIATGVSFNGNKTFTCGSGGVILTPDATLARKLKHLTTTAREPGRYRHDVAGFNYRMSNLEAAVGCAQLEQFESFLARKRKIADRYSRIASRNDIPARAFPSPDWARHSWWFSGLVLDQGIDTSAVIDVLRKAGIGALPFWEPMHLQPPYADAPRYLNGVSEDLAPRVLVLPNSTSLSDADLDKVEAAVVAALQRSSN